MMTDYHDDDGDQSRLLVKDLLSGLITHHSDLGSLGIELIQLLRAAGYKVHDHHSDSDELVILDENSRAQLH